MDIASLGFRTDVALLRRSGSEVTDRGDHLVVRTPDNPDFRWGNFLLLESAPAAADVPRWRDRFATEFPDADHVALGLDCADPGPLQAEVAAALTRSGLSVETSTVMTATAVGEPPVPNRDAEVRALSSDRDWDQSVALLLTCGEGEEEGAAYERFARARTQAHRDLVEAGHGAWFGAFLDGLLVSQLGLVSADAGLARFQSVETHPEARGRGLAGTLVHHAGRFGLTRLSATTLVMVADPEYAAIRVYRSVGFADTQTHWTAECRAVTTGSAAAPDR